MSTNPSADFSPEEGASRLSPDDQQAIDRLFAEGWMPDAVSCPRTKAAASCMRLLDDYPMNDADELLLAATLARIERHERESGARMRIEPSPGEMAVGRRFRLADLISVAAVVLVGAGVALPLMNQVRRSSIETACANNLRIVGNALQNYATDHRGQLPATAGLPDFFSLKDAGVSASPLDLLSKMGYCDRGHLNCPGHACDGPAYSYQVQTAGRRVAFGVGPVVAVIGDRNPLIDAARQGHAVSSTQSTVNHDGRGQNVLRSDGLVEFLKTPLMDGRDNIWLPRTESGVECWDNSNIKLAPGDSVLLH